MSQPLDKLIKKIQLSGKVLTHQEQDKLIGVEHTSPSCYLKKLKLLVKGENSNPKSSERNALITFFDVETHKIWGKTIVFNILIILNI